MKIVVSYYLYGVFMIRPKRQKHNYTSELELKSILIRIQNMKDECGEYDDNKRIGKYVKWHTDLSNCKDHQPERRNTIKHKIRDKVVELSEKTKSDDVVYERFGEIILLMVKNILKSPKFSRYTYFDDFYSDAVFKIIKYLHNFDHTKISVRTNQRVNAFAYISQIIFNSVLFVIISKGKDSKKIDAYQVDMQIQNESQVNSFEHHRDITDTSVGGECTITKILTLDVITHDDFLETVFDWIESNPADSYVVIIPDDFKPTADELTEVVGHSKSIIVEGSSYEIN